MSKERPSDPIGALAQEAVRARTDKITGVPRPVRSALVYWRFLCAGWVPRFPDGSDRGGVRGCSALVASVVMPVPGHVVEAPVTFQQAPSGEDEIIPCETGVEEEPSPDKSVQGTNGMLLPTHTPVLSPKLAPTPTSTPGALRTKPPENGGNTAVDGWSDLYAHYPLKPNAVGAQSHIPYEDFYSNGSMEKYWDDVRQVDPVRQYPDNGGREMRLPMDVVGMYGEQDNGTLILDSIYPPEQPYSSLRRPVTGVVIEDPEGGKYGLLVGTDYSVPEAAQGVLGDFVIHVVRDPSNNPCILSTTRMSIVSGGGGVRDTSATIPLPDQSALRVYLGGDGLGIWLPDGYGIMDRSEALEAMEVLDGIIKSNEQSRHIGREFLEWKRNRS